MIPLSLLTEIVTASDKFCRKFTRRDACIWLLFLGMITSEGLGIQDYPHLRRSKGPVRSAEIRQEHPPGDNEQNQRDLETNCQHCHPPNINQKITLSFQLSLVTILKMHFLFCLYRAYLITYWQALVGAHCSIYTCTISKICFYFLLFLLVCLFETVWTQSLN